MLGPVARVANTPAPRPKKMKDVAPKLEELTLHEPTLTYSPVYLDVSKAKAAESAKAPLANSPKKKVAAKPKTSPPESWPRGWPSPRSKLPEKTAQPPPVPEKDDFLLRLDKAEEMPPSLILPLMQLAANSPPPRPTGEQMLLDSSRTDCPTMTDREGRGYLINRDGKQKLEVTVINHPVYSGVIISNLGPDGACARHGLKVGDHVLKINDIRTTDHRTAVWLADSAERRVKFSLADTTKTFRVDRDHGGDVGLTLVNNTVAGIGCVVAHVAKGRSADGAGLKVGHCLLSVDGVLCVDHKAVITQIDQSQGVVALVVANSLVTEESVLNQALSMVPCDIEVES